MSYAVVADFGDVHQTFDARAQSDKGAKRFKSGNHAVKLGPSFNAIAHGPGGLVLLSFEQSPPRDDDITALMSKLYNLEGHLLAAVIFGVFDILSIDLRVRAKPAHITLYRHTQAPLIDRVDLPFYRHPRFISLVENVRLRALTAQPTTYLHLITGGDDKGFERIANFEEQFALGIIELASADYRLAGTCIVYKAALALNLNNHTADLITGIDRSGSLCAAILVEHLRKVFSRSFSYRLILRFTWCLNQLLCCRLFGGFNRSLWRDFIAICNTGFENRLF